MIDLAGASISNAVIDGEIARNLEARGLTFSDFVIVARPNDLRIVRSCYPTNTPYHTITINALIHFIPSMNPAASGVRLYADIDQAKIAEFTNFSRHDADYPGLW